MRIPFFGKRRRAAQSHTVDWTGGRFYVMPQEPRSGRFEGQITRVRTRTWAGCTMMPNEADHYPEIPVLQLGEAFAPLKQAPADPRLVTTMKAEAAAWRARKGTGPPYVRSEDTWADRAPAEHTTVEGFWYPVFAAGTIQSWRIWGLYLTGG